MPDDSSQLPTSKEAEPRWSLSTIYPSMESAPFQDDKVRLRERVRELERYMDAHGVSPGAEGSATTLEGLIERLEAAYLPLVTLRGFLGAIISVDSFDEAARAELSALTPYTSKLAALGARFQGWLASLDLEPLALASKLIAENEYPLQREQLEGRHLMSQEAEELAALLDDVGGDAWGRLHSSLISRSTIQATLLASGSEGEYGMAQLRTLQANPDEAVRRRAYLAERELLQRNEVAYAAAMNGVKGQAETLAQRRGWGGAFRESLHLHSITPESLAAMHDATEERFPVLRGYLKAKAWQLGKQRLGWYDLWAPLPHASASRHSWRQAKAFIVEQFGTYSLELAAFAQRAFLEEWIDVPPRKGKRNGAYCMPVPARGESRIMLNFGGTQADLFTLAHELGHAYHNDCTFRFGRSILQSQTPMTLAETASIFCETIVLEGVLAGADDRTRLVALEQHLTQATQLILDIHSRYLFEATVLERRRERELSAQEFRQIMDEAQARTYGDGLNPEERHDLMWAHKGHYYSADLSFYNYPYTFGFLFGLGLYAQYKQNPDAFRGRYDELLASTGLADAATLARSFGIDIEDKAFWRASLDVVEERVSAFQALTERVTR